MIEFDPLVLSLAIIIGVIVIIAVIGVYFPEALGFILSILVSVGIISVSFVYIKPEIDEIGDPNLEIIFYISVVAILVTFFVVMNLFVSSYKKQKKKLREIKKSAG